MQNPLSHLISQSAVYQGVASAHGLLFDYHAEYPCAVSSILRTDTILGELYQLVDPSTTFRDLDTYEDCYPDDSGRSLFVRCVVPVHEQESGKAVHAWMYFWNRSVDSMVLIGSGDYRKHSR